MKLSWVVEEFLFGRHSYLHKSDLPTNVIPTRLEHPHHQPFGWFFGWLGRCMGMGMDMGMGMGMRMGMGMGLGMEMGMGYVEQW
jgi:hypothetical protein